VRRRSALVLICVASVALLFITITVIAQYLAPTSSGPLGPIDKSTLPQPKTLADKMCCIGDGVHYCATASHGEVNGIRYYAAATQKGNYPAHVATEQTLTIHPFKRDADYCECKDSAYVPLEQLQKASTREDEMLVGHSLQKQGLQRYITATEELKRGEGTHQLDDFVVQIDGARWFRLFEVETYPEVGDGATKRATQMVRFGQELDPSSKPAASKKATLVETLGCFLKLQVGDKIFFVLARGPDSNNRDEAKNGAAP